MSTERPIQRVQVGAIEASVWKNPTKDSGVRFSATIQRRYRDQSGEWHSTQSFGRDDLLLLAKAADLA